MAKRGRPRVSLGKALEALLLSRPFTIGDNILEETDQRRVANAMALWLLTFKDISKWYGLERVYSAANLQRCASRLAGCDVDKVLSTLDALLQSLRLWSHHMGDQRFKAFKAHFLQPDCDPCTFELVWPLLTLFYREAYSPYIFQGINTVCQFWKRLTLKNVKWVEEKSLQDYLDLEGEMSEWEYPQDIINELRTIITEWMQGWTLWGHRPHHSNGATAEVSRGQGKARKYSGMSEYSNHEMLGALSGYGANPLVSNRVAHFCDKSAVYQLVPKGINKKRGISMEPTENQYWQHAIADSLSEWFDSHTHIGVDLHDQDLSRQKCLKGSRTLRYGTIDLSNASDTVTWKLVTQIFCNTTLLTSLSLSRTRSVSIDGSILSLAKYAPMGSALCFPIECLVFASIASLACKRSGCNADYRVYGDDIVIPCAAFKECCTLLKDLHFTVNEEKSYGPYSSFLEACGMEAYWGVDVTPCRVSRWWDIVSLRTGMSPTSLEGSIVLANRLFDYCLFETRRYVIEDILDHYDSVPFSVDPERGIYHPDPQNWHLRCRWNPDLQKAEYLIHVSVSKCSNGPERIRYTQALEEMETTRRTALIDPLDRIEVKVGSTRTTLQKRWCDLEGLRLGDRYRANK